MKYLILHITILMLLLNINSSCCKECVNPGPETLMSKVTLLFDWEEVCACDTVPSGVTVIFYNKTTNAVIKMDVNCKGKIESSLPSGEYDVLIFNNDSKTYKFKNLDSFDKAEAYLMDLNTKADDSSYACVAGQLYTTNVKKLVISSTLPVTTTFFPKPATKSLNIELDNTSVGELAACIASVNNVVSGINLSKRTPAQGYESSYNFNMEKGDNGFQSIVRLLGVTNANTCNLKLDYTLTNGTTGTVSIPLKDAVTALNSAVGGGVKLDVEMKRVAIGITARLTGWKLEEEGQGNVND